MLRCRSSSGSDGSESLFDGFNRCCHRHDVVRHVKAVVGDADQGSPERSDLRKHRTRYSDNHLGRFCGSYSSLGGDLEVRPQAWILAGMQPHAYSVTMIVKGFCGFHQQVSPWCAIAGFRLVCHRCGDKDGVFFRAICGKVIELWVPDDSDVMSRYTPVGCKDCRFSAGLGGCPNKPAAHRHRSFGLHRIEVGQG